MPDSDVRVEPQDPSASSPVQAQPAKPQVVDGKHVETAPARKSERFKMHSSTGLERRGRQLGHAVRLRSPDGVGARSGPPVTHRRAFDMSRLKVPEHRAVLEHAGANYLGEVPEEWGDLLRRGSLTAGRLLGQPEDTGGTRAVLDLAATGARLRR